MKRYIIVTLCLLFVSAGIQPISAQMAGNQMAAEKSHVAREYEWFSLAMVGTSFNKNQLSYSLMYGKVKRWGWYGKIKTDFNFKVSNSDKYYSSNDVFWNGEKSDGRIAATVGTIWNMTRPVMLYAGAGYGRRWVDWETISKQKIRIHDQSYDGAEFELGLIARWKNVLLSVGASLNTDDIYIGNLETNIAIGYKF